jgi:hypothetical protein
MKTIELELEGLDGNAYSLMGAFRRQARHEGWEPEEIEAVMKEAKSGDYDNLIAVLLKYSRSPDEEEGYFND